MRVFLVRPNSVLRATTFPLGMGYVGEAARNAGHEVSFLDARLERLSALKTVERISSARPDVIGVSAIHFEKHGVLELITALRANALKVPVVLGGPLVSTSGRELVLDGVLDAAIAGEGETAFTAYLEALSGRMPLAEVPSLIYRENGEVWENQAGPLLADLDSARPAWDLIRPDTYFKSFGRSTQNMLRHSPRSVSIFTSRGCPFGCIYCHNIFGRKFRPRSPESVISEIKFLKSRYGVEELDIVDDAFNVNLPRAKEIARGLIEEGLGLHISFSNGLRADLMDEELIDLLKQAGTYRINYAVESASPRIQKLIHKNLNLDKTRKIIAATADRGIFTFGYFMLGFPTETVSELEQTLDYAFKSKLHAASFFYVNPFPGTEMFRQYPVPEEARPRLDQMDYTVLKVNLSEAPDQVLRRFSKQAYRRFHFSPPRMWRTFQVVPKNFRTVWSVGMIAVLSLFDKKNL